MRTPTPQVVRTLVTALSADDAALRSTVKEALGQLPDAISLLSLLQGNARERILGIEAIAALNDPRGPQWLLQVATTEQDPNVVASALEGLAGCGSVPMIAELDAVKARFAHVPFIAFAVDVAIARIREHGP
jgi:HEAT repeat protein